MLPQDWQFLLYNDTGVSLDFSANSANESATVKYRRHHLDTNIGDLEHEDSVQTDSAGADVADGAVVTFGGATGDTEIGLTGTLQVETDNTSAAGRVYLWIEASLDGGTTYPSDDTDFSPDTDLNAGGAIFLGSIKLTGAEIHTINIAV